MRHRNKIIGIGVAAVAISVVGAYIVREHSALWVLDGTPAQQVQSGSETFLIVSEDRPVGHARIEVAVDARGIRVQESGEMRVRTLDGQVHVLRHHSDQWLDRSLEIARFFVSLRTGPVGTAPAVTEVTGVRDAEGGLRVEVRKDEDVVWHYVQPRPALVLGPGLWPRIAAMGDIPEGTRRIFEELDPTTLAIQPAELVVGGVENHEGRSGRAMTHTVGMRANRLLVGERGLPVWAELSLGLAMRPAQDSAIAALRQAWARAEYGRGGEIDLVARSAIGAGVELPSRESMRGMQIVWSGIPTLPPDVEGGNQRVSRDTILITRSAWPQPGAAGYELRGVGAPSRLASNTALAPFLASVPFIEADHPEIQAATFQVVGGRSDPAEAARAITMHVYRTLEKRYRVSVPSALNVLRTAEGDCNEHTMLAVAMLRAAGIPARPVSGFAYAENAFYPHAWVEAWLGGQWVSMDPTFGTAPADPARLRMFVGIENLNSVLSAAGRLRLSVTATF
jgi:hypothetical protein